MSSDGAAAAATDDITSRLSTQNVSGSKTPPTPPGSPVDRPFPVTTPVCKNVLQMIREEGDGCRRGKSDLRMAKKSASHRSANTDLPPRQPSDGYQILDDVHGQPPPGSGTSSDHLQQQQQPGASSTSDSDDSSSEFDWSDDDAEDSSESNSVDEVNEAARAAADGMSSDTESECLL